MTPHLSLPSNLEASEGGTTLGGTRTRLPVLELQNLLWGTGAKEIELSVRLIFTKLTGTDAFIHTLMPTY